MFKCRGCEALKEENERLHKLVDRLLDKTVGPVPEPEKGNEDPVPPPPFQQIRDKDGNLIEEMETFGGP